MGSPTETPTLNTGYARCYLLKSEVYTREEVAAMSDAEALGRARRLIETQEQETSMTSAIVGRSLRDTDLAEVVSRCADSIKSCAVSMDLCAKAIEKIESRVPEPPSTEGGINQMEKMTLVLFVLKQIQDLQEMSKKRKVIVTISVVWLIVVFGYASGDAQRSVFYTGRFLHLLSWAGLLPVVVAWGFVWIFDNKN